MFFFVYPTLLVKIILNLRFKEILCFVTFSKVFLFAIYKN